MRGAQNVPVLEFQQFGKTLYCQGV